MVKLAQLDMEARTRESAEHSRRRDGGRRQSELVKEAFVTLRRNATSADAN